MDRLLMVMVMVLRDTAHSCVRLYEYKRFSTPFKHFITRLMTIIAFTCMLT